MGEWLVRYGVIFHAGYRAAWSTVLLSGVLFSVHPAFYVVIFAAGGLRACCP